MQLLRAKVSFYHKTARDGIRLRIDKSANFAGNCFATAVRFVLGIAQPLTGAVKRRCRRTLAVTAAVTDIV